MQARPPVQVSRKTPALSADARYLIEVLDRLKISANKLAEEIGVPASTLSRHVPRPDGTPKSNTPRNMHPEIKAKIEAYSRIAAPSAVDTNGPEPIRRTRGFAEDLAVYDPSMPEGDPVIGQIVALLLRDRPNAYPMQVRSRALVDAGYRVGDIVIVDQSVRPLPGQAVCAQAYDRFGGAETIFRIYRTVGPVRMLFASLSDPTAEALLVDETGEAGAKIMGTVTESFRPRRAA